MDAVQNNTDHFADDANGSEVAEEVDHVGSRLSGYAAILFNSPTHNNEALVLFCGSSVL